MEVVILGDPDAVATLVADAIERLVVSKPRNVRQQAPLAVHLTDCPLSVWSRGRATTRQPGSRCQGRGQQLPPKIDQLR